MKRTLNGRFFRNLLMLSWMLLAVASPASATHQPGSPLTKWVNGKKYILHKVVKKDTWSSLSRKYHVSIADLEKANPGVAVLKLSQIIQIPTEKDSVQNKAEEKTAPVSEPKQTTPKTTSEKNKIHTVIKGETLYHIAKSNDISVDEIKKLNHLTSNNVAVGQKLILSGAAQEKTPKAEDTPKNDPPKATLYESATTKDKSEIEKEAVKENKTEASKNVKEEKQVAVEKDEKAPVPKPVFVKPSAKDDSVKPMHVDSPSVYSNPGNSRAVFSEKDLKTGTSVDKIIETGVATWITDGELNQNKFYALHRTAPVGTIIKVTNRMNNNSVYVKVVGMLPDTGDNANIIIKITQAAAQRIGALDQKFTAELSYGVTK